MNRAAWGLANLNAVSAVPKLVGVLITVRYEVVMASASGGSGDEQSGAFGSVPPSPSCSVGPNAISYGPNSLPTFSLPESPALSGAYAPSSSGLGVSAGGGLLSTRGPTPGSSASPIGTPRCSRRW